MEGAAQTVLINVGQLVGQEFRQLRAVGGEVAELKDELATMNTLLRMQSEADGSGLSHFVREWMKQLQELAYDTEDCVDLYLFRIRCRQGDGFLLWSKRLLATLFPRHRLAGEITALRLRAVSISERHARYGVSMDLLGRSASSSEASQAVVASARALPLRPHNDHNQFQLVGIKAQAAELAIKVNASVGEDDKKIKVFSIVGFGGLGKTTLAMEVCRQLEMEFERQAVVSASQSFGSKDVEGLLKHLFRQILRLKSQPVAPNNKNGQPKETSERVDLKCEEASSEEAAKKALEEGAKHAADVAKKLAELLGKIDSMNVGQLQSEVGESLRDSRFLILIDDVWSKAAWEAIWSKLPSSNCSSRIIVTTRIDTVAKACSNVGDYYIHHMKALEEEESKRLFRSKAFGSISEDSCPKEKELEGEIETILKKCGGLPLAIVSIASLLASYTHPEGKKMWQIVGRSTGSQMDINPTLEGMRQILTLSYDHLPHHLKACMMYLSIFPEDYIICKDRLLKRWIAEGLIPEKRGMTQMELAEAYFSELMSRSMIDQGIDIVNMYQWREETCRVHDMMLEVIVSKSLESNFVSLVGGQYEGMSYDRIRRLTIHGGVEAAQELSSKKMALHHGTWNGIKGMTMQHVRSLSIFDSEVPKLLARLGEFTLLRVLDMEDCKGLEEKYLKHICRMYLLRFLSLKGTDIKQMPSRIGNLEHLQTLDVRQTQLTSLPETVIKLEKLEHLLFTTKGNLWSAWMAPRGINRMKALRHLNKVIVIDPMVAKEIGELDQLQELCIYVDSRHEIHPDVPEGLACSLSMMYSLEWLDIGNFGCELWPFVQVLNFLHGVETPPRLLRYLRICGRIDKLPDWVGSLTNLIEFDIAWTYLDGDQLFNVLCKLPNLERLTLGPYFIRHVEYMVAGSNQSFRELKELTLGYSPEVPRVYIFKEGCMPKLETLVLNYGDQWKKMEGIEHLTKLKEVQIGGITMEGAVAETRELLKEENERQRNNGSEQIRVVMG
ncbi:hypothetical protein CFC21_075742 [Triticum aestivum]|uniref:NB-ARC domain-containing protein n=2 Tax=Triticum aestivum TaxID=4565 RepID=A0A3B6MKF3_WHEAT|nr:disease resistance protein Pik-2-like [Triticum aestivum]KAF7070198.1 hypothetical protein CFC21_075742 [Triticum aestivum]